MSNLKSKFFLGVMIVAVMFVGVVAVKTAAASTATDCPITATLRVGSKGAQVKCLQAAVGATADGRFGKMTKAAVKVWQAANGLVADGIFGPKGRAVYNGMVVVNPNPNPTPTPTSGPLAVSLAASNPVSGNILSGQALADLAHFTFTGNGTLSQVTLQRTGLSVSADVANVYLFDGNTRLTDGASVNTAGNVVFNNVNIAVNGSRTLSVRADMAAATSSVNLGVTLTGYMVTGSTTANAVSVAGNLFYVSTAPIGGTTATLNATTVSSGNVNAGSMNYTLWSNGLQVNGRSANLAGLNLHFIGSAPTDAVQNLKLYVDGAQVGSSISVSSTGYATFDLGAAPAMLGVSTHTIEVRGDVVKGSNRNFQFSLQNASDLMLTDSQIGININAAFAVSNGVAGTITVNPGSVTVSLDPTFSSTTTVTGGATNVTIAKYKFQAYGEDMKITSLTVTPTVAGGTPGTTSMNNVALYANGGQIGSSQNYVATPLVFSLGSSLIVAAGTTTIVEVRADTINATPANYSAGTLTVKLAGSTSNAQGMSSQNLATAPSTSGITSGALTIGAATATVAVSNGLNSKNVISNTAKTKIGSFVVQAGNTEGVRVTNLQVGLVFGAAAPTYTSGTVTVGSQSVTFSSTVNMAVGDVITIPGATAAVGTITSITSTTVAVVNITTGGVTPAGTITGTSGPMTIANVSNLYTSDDTVNITGNPTATNNFSVNYTIAPSTSKTIDVYADLGSLNAGTVQSSLKITAVGASTNVALTTGTGIATALVGQVMTVAAGSLATPTLTTASMSAQFVVGGTSPSTATYNFVATNGDALITQLKFTITSNTTGISCISVAGSPCAPVVSGVADVSGLNIIVPAGYAGKDVLVTPTFNMVGIGGETSNTTPITTLDYVKYTVGTTTTVATPSVATSTMTLVGTKPAVTVTGSSDTLTNSSVKVLEVTVAADIAGDLKLTALPITVTSTGAVNIVTGAQNITVKDTSGTTITTTNAGLGVATNASGSDTINFTSGYLIPKGTTKTFRIYVTPVGVVATNSLSSKLGVASSMTWTDVNGNVAGITGTPIANYPTDTFVVKNY